MKNGEKYACNIEKALNEHSFKCSIRKVMDDVTGVSECIEYKTCTECGKCMNESLEWLNQEYKEPILTEEEKDIIRHFVEAYSGICSKIVKVIKTGSFNVVCLKFLSGSTSSIYSVNFVTISPEISKDVMFKGMELNVAYTLEELGL